MDGLPQGPAGPGRACCFELIYGLSWTIMDRLIDLLWYALFIITHVYECGYVEVKSTSILAITVLYVLVFSYTCAGRFRRSPSTSQSQAYFLAQFIAVKLISEPLVACLMYFFARHILDHFSGVLVGLRPTSAVAVATNVATGSGPGIWCRRHWASVCWQPLRSWIPSISAFPHRPLRRLLFRWGGSSAIRRIGVLHRWFPARDRNS